MKLSYLHETLTGYKNQSSEDNLPLSWNDTVSGNIMKQEKYYNKLKSVLARSKWPLNIIILSEFALTAEKDQYEKIRRHFEKHKGEPGTENAPDNQPVDFVEIWSKNNFQYRPNQDNHFVDQYIKDNFQENAINLVIVGNPVSDIIGWQKNLLLTPWMILHQIGEHLLDSSKNIFGKSWREAPPGRLRAPGGYSIYKFLTPENEHIDLDETTLLKMCKSRACRTSTAQGPDVVAELVADYLWHGKLRRVNNKQYEKYYNAIEHTIDMLLANEIGKIIKPLEIFR
jgi:hypothetical protein